METVSGGDPFLDSALLYLSSLPPDVADAAFRASILRWFDAQVLGQVLGVSCVSSLGASATAAGRPPEEIDRRLQDLPFAEPFPGHGHSFHERTRKALLDHLWHKEHDFYRAVSARARDYFQECWDRQIKSDEDGEPDSIQIVLDLLVEILYHDAIANESEPEAIARIDEVIESLFRDQLSGIYHALILAISEHAEAGRLTPVGKAWVKYWQLREVHEAYDLAQVETLAEELRGGPDSDTPPELKARATYWLAYGLWLASRYDDAKGYFEENIWQWEQLKDPVERLNAVVGLGDVEYSREEIACARTHYSEALACRVGQLRRPASEDSGFGDDTPLRVLDPDAWDRREVYRDDADQARDEDLVVADRHEEAPEDLVVADGDEEAREVNVLYFIGIDTDAAGIDTTARGEGASQDLSWPIDFDPLLAKLWLKLGYLDLWEDRYDEAVACGRLAGQLSIDLEDLRGAQSAVQLLGSLGAILGDLKFVKMTGEMQHEILITASAHGNQEAELYGLIIEAKSELAASRYDDARTLYEEIYRKAKALENANQMTSRNQMATCQDGLARISWIEEDLDSAIEHFNASITLYEQVKNRGGFADSCSGLGSLHKSRRHFFEAKEAYRKALETYEALGSFTGRFRSLLNLSSLSSSTGDYDSASRYLEQALDLARENKRLSEEAKALAELAKLHGALGDEASRETLSRRPSPCSTRSRTCNSRRASCSVGRRPTPAWRSMPRPSTCTIG